MPVYVLLTPDQLALEREADDLLRDADQDPERPFYSERQLSRHGRVVAGTDLLVNTVSTPCQALRDELRFLASVTDLDIDRRRVLGFWADGWAQTEVASALCISQQRVSQLLRSALEACYDAKPISFREFSRHSIYRAPRRRREACRMRVCLRCGEEFAAFAGAGRYCSGTCREMCARGQ